jgi:hemin uptake protein HemP
MSIAEFNCTRQADLADADSPSNHDGGEKRPPVYNSDELLQGCREAWIEHGQQMYRLRLTQAGKLYLTK